MSERERRRLDEIEGLGAGLGLAAGMGIVSGVATVLVLAGWLRAADIGGTFQPEAGGLLAAAGWWVLFWLALSAGVLASLWLGYRAWRVLYPVKQRRDESREEREAIAAAQAIVEAARGAGAREE